MDISTSTRARDLIRYLQCRGLGGGSFDTARYAYGAGSVVPALLERSVLDQASISGDKEGRLALAGFLEMVRARSLIGKIAGFRKVPSDTRILVQTGLAIPDWTIEGEAIPVTVPEFDSQKLRPLSIGGIVPISQELMRAIGDANAEQAIGRDLARGVADLESLTLIDPNNAGEADKRPASLLYGVDPVESSADAVEDVERLISDFAGDLEAAVMVTDPRTAVRLRGAGFEGAGARGGDVAGIPLVTSSAVPADSDGSLIALIDPSGTLLVDAGIEFAVSTETTLDVGDEVGVSLFQQDLAAIRVVRALNWRPQAGRVSWVRGVQYGG